MMRKKISQDLILLDDIEVNGSPGLRIVKAHIKEDLKAMQKAISKVEKTTRWEWKDQRSHPSSALIPRVILEINQVQHEIVSRPYTSIDLIRHSSFNCYRANKSLQEVCVSCRRPIEDLWREIYFWCNHDWCESCFDVLLELSFVDSRFMPPECCGDGRLGLYPVAALCDDTFEQRWSETFLDTMGYSAYYCPIDTCGNRIKPRDYHWFVWPTEYRGYSRCSRCKTVHFLRMTMRRHRMTVKRHCYAQN